MSEISKGDLVRFKSGKYVVTTQKKRIEYDLKGEVGMVKTVFEEGALYEVCILLEGKHYFLKVESSEIEKVGTGVGISEEQATRLIDIMRKIRENFGMRVICTGFPDPNSWIRSIEEQRSASESKMTKARCIKLLESYRAEREKIAKGRKFERCLRDSVVNEALERAIELLKGNE